MADESFMSTILLNQPRFKILLNNKRYVHWNPADPYAGSPRVIQCNDIDAVLNSDAHFARKFDIGLGNRALDLIDERLGVCAVTSDPKSSGDFPAPGGSSGIAGPSDTY